MKTIKQGLAPDSRRAIRTGVHTVGALVMLGYLGWIIGKTDKLQLIALGLVAILFIRELGHAAENVVARIKFSAGLDGFSGEVDSTGETK